MPRVPRAGALTRSSREGVSGRAATPRRARPGVGVAGGVPREACVVASRAFGEPGHERDRLIVSERSLSATNDIEDDVLPPLGPSGYVEASALGIVGDHISRHRPAVPLSARVHRMPNGAFVLTTVVSERSR